MALPRETAHYNRFVRWRRAGVWDQRRDALTCAVQMIDARTSMGPASPSRLICGGIERKCRDYDLSATRLIRFPFGHLHFYEQWRFRRGYGFWNNPDHR